MTYLLSLSTGDTIKKVKHDLFLTYVIYET